MESSYFLTTDDTDGTDIEIDRKGFEKSTINTDRLFHLVRESRCTMISNDFIRKPHPC